MKKELLLKICAYTFFVGIIIGAFVMLYTLQKN